MTQQKLPPRLQRIIDEKGHVTVREFAEAVGISYPNVLRRIYSGDIPAVNVSESHTSWRIFEDDLAAWFATRRNRRPIEAPADEPNKKLGYYDAAGHWHDPA